MKVRITTVVVDERARLAISHRAGNSGKASRAAVRAFYADAGDAAIADACAEWDAIQMPRLPFGNEPDEKEPHDSATV